MAKKKVETIEMEQVIDYLNEKANKKFRYTKKHFSFIQARFNEGFNFEDFKIVINNKCFEWNNTNMEKYLRPETLFGNKMDGYINQKNIIKKAGDVPSNEEIMSAKFSKKILDKNPQDPFAAIYKRKLKEYEDKYGKLEE